MEYRENPMFGRRVFFLNPPLSVENSVIPVLKDKTDVANFDQEFTSENVDDASLNQIVENIQAQLKKAADGKKYWVVTAE